MVQSTIHDSSPQVGPARRCGPCSAAALALILVLVALPIRCYLASTAGMISRDGAGFIWYAQALSRGPVAAMREYDQHPLYSALVLGMYRMMGPLRHFWPDVRAISDVVIGWQTAAMLVTLLSGLAVILAMYAFTTAMFGRRIGLWAALLTALAAEFCQLSADALSDMTHLTLYLFALACAIRGLRTGATASFAGAGVLSGLAFLCRPEGAEVAVALSLVLLAMPSAFLPGLRKAPVRETSPASAGHGRIRAVAAVCIGAMIVASPYMVVTGRLVRKKPVTGFVAIRTMQTVERNATAIAMFGSPLPMRGEILAKTADLPKGIRAFLLIGEKNMRTLRVTLLLPALVYFFLLLRLRRAPRVASSSVESQAPPDATLEVEATPSRAVFVLLAIIVVMHVLILLRLLFRFDYWEMLSIRHVLILGAITIPFSAAGVVLVLSLVPEPRRRLAAVGMVVLLVAPTFPWMFERRNVQDLYLRRAGEWIRGQQPSGARVFTTRNLVAFYANGVHVWSPPDANLDSILAEVRDQRPDWLVFDVGRIQRQSLTFFWRLTTSPRPGERFDLAHTTRARPEESPKAREQPPTARVYRYAAPP